MSTNQPLRLLTENLPELRVLEAIFLPELERGLVRLSSYLTASATTSGAELSLLEDPEVPLAVVLNARTLDRRVAQERCDSTIRYLARTAESGWQVTYAVPDVDSWLMADPHVRKVFDADEATRQSRIERAVRIGAIAREQPLDRTAIGKAHLEFQELCQFIEQHTQSLHPMA